ncbi:MAG: GNAT family N-acetyltransferase [Clostridia bacterium]|nr:GNAT family N-acetyltransferase [Clostridia bacterium]
MNIIYKEIDQAIEEKIVKQYGSWVHDWNCLVKGEGCYLVAATDGDIIAGFAALHPAQWIAPLEQYSDAFIEVIEVSEDYRRKGIGSTLVKMMEDFAKTYGYYQIRSWSSVDKVEALHMWRKLKYAMCPAAMLGEPVKETDLTQIPGFYYAKLLNENALN